jgi:integrase
LDRAPAVRLLKEPTRRIRFPTQDQAVALLRELPEHLREMATFALATGLRAANVMGLTWEQVDLSRKLAWIHPDQAKARRAIAVPLNETAAAVVSRQVGRHPERVFTYQGQPVKQVSTKA